VIQFGEAPPAGSEETDLLVDFITNGSEAQTPYGLNGFGSGRMPAFGSILDGDDIELLARFLRSGNLNGMEEE
jgi:mono/diheme cytochrome c family protein